MVYVVGNTIMTWLKLTSPGVLLILAILAAAGIFLLDLFYLGPNIDAQKWAALREEAVRTEHGTRLALQSEQRALSGAAVAWARAESVRQFAQGGTSADPESLLAEQMGPAKVERVWLTDANGDVLGVWPNEPSSPPPTAKPIAETIGASVKALEAEASSVRAGLINLPSGPGIFARHPISSGADGQTGGFLYAARAVSSDLLARLSFVSGGRLVLINGQELPGGTDVEGSAKQATWLSGEDQLAVAWFAQDAAGRAMGYFLATVPVVHIHRQAVTSHRIILITLSLSVALALLVILGSHMLITGPVVRLLSRLQRLDAGQGNPENLARNLHGEPLMLARRLENAFEKLAHISKTDELTGLANRRHFEEVLGAFYVQARRYNRPLSVIVMDVDFFKAVNDTGGHQAGDDVLKRMSGAIEDACRKADLPARFGGDEFAVLLPETGAADAEAVGERIRRSVDGRKITVGELELHVTVSIGIADLNAGEMDGPGAMMGLADRALYAAKQLGRNRIVQAHDLHVNPPDGQENESRKINVLSKKLAGLDSQFKDLFVQAFDEVMGILQARDPHMANHTRKVQHYATLIAREMELPDRVIKRIEIAATMHDIGMVAMPDDILLCPAELDEGQMQLMRRHPLLSVRIMERMEFLEQEIPAVRYHHERYDGRGYPEGIAGASIPLTARILAVADAFDAITSPRTFRDAKGLAESLGEIHRAAGTQFDPAVVNAFISVADSMGQELLHVPGLCETRPDEPAGPSRPAQAPSPAWRLDEAVEAEHSDRTNA